MTNLTKLNGMDLEELREVVVTEDLESFDEAVENEYELYLNSELRRIYTESGKAVADVELITKERIFEIGKELFDNMNWEGQEFYIGVDKNIGIVPYIYFGTRNQGSFSENESEIIFTTNLDNYNWEQFCIDEIDLTVEELQNIDETGDSEEGIEYQFINNSLIPLFEEKLLNAVY